MALPNVLDGGFVFFFCCFVNPVELVISLTGFVGRNDDRLEAIDFLKLIGLGVGCSGHARQLAIQAEVILKGDGGHGLVFGLNRHTLFGLHRLVQTIAPASA